MIVVTGGTKGIGKAIIHKFAQAGHAVAVCARNEQDLMALKTEVESTYGIKVYAQPADLSKKEEAMKFIDFVLQTGEEVDILVNNTGVFVPGAIHEEEDGVLEMVMQTNLYSAYYLSRGFIKGMKERQEGHIFNIASVAGIMAYPNGGTYAISKHAMMGLSKCLREELKPHNIKVTSIMPGATYTASWDGVELPEDRFSKPEDVADVVYASYILSDRSCVEEVVIRPQLGDL
ncbi:SDR family oxidoreductase [Algivirga pacifica]|uniref:SDR family oxidoreductase n=1 Tax=Algivirga pacifica TaxID=1162670 RepID=A0ABP9D1Q4_9BACT